MRFVVLTTCWNDFIVVLSIIIVSVHHSLSNISSEIWINDLVSSSSASLLVSSRVSSRFLTAITEYFQASHSLRSLPGLYLDHSKTVVTVQCICTMQHTQWKVYSTKGARYFLRSVCQLSPPTKGLYKIRTGLWILCACVRERGRAREGTLPKEATGGHAVFTSTNKHTLCRPSCLN